MILRMMPCLDSEEMAGARRRELDIRRDDAKELGQSAVSAAKNGGGEPPGAQASTSFPWSTTGIAPLGRGGARNSEADWPVETGNVYGL